MPHAGEVESFKPRCKDVEEVRVQLLGTGCFKGFKSGMLRVLILNGTQLLRFLARASQEALLSSVPLFCQKLRVNKCFDGSISHMFCLLPSVATHLKFKAVAVILSFGSWHALALIRSRISPGLDPAGQVGSMHVAKVALSCCRAIVESLKLASSETLLLVEGVDVASKQDWSVAAVFWRAKSVSPQFRNRCVQNNDNEY